ncbi:hypothetical protein [Actinophytocola sp.]|uniref:hypothetical protein n=1 Tax=Actinophytocola sp. TaxID=1872138 RepID=UPI0025BAFC0B|nr:hypothetical protein [Actinophytocola sp.]
MIDVNQVNATHREIGDHAVATGEGRSLLLRRAYDAPIEDAWSACTDPDRISRWLAPVKGEHGDRRALPGGLDLDLLAAGRPGGQRRLRRRDHARPGIDIAAGRAPATRPGEE